MDQLTQEFQLILALLRADTISSKMERINTLTSQNMNWDSFLRLVSCHGLYPQIYEVLNSLPERIAPEVVMLKLQKQCRDNAARAMEITSELARIVCIMQENGIKVVALKGQTLAQRLYGNIALRMSGDIDLLVAPEVLTKAEEILVCCGYCEEYAEQRMTIRRRNIHFENSHHSNFSHDERKMHLELHWRLGSAGVELPLAEVPKLQEVKLVGCTVSTLADEPLLLFLAIHGAKHCWLHLRWLYDIVKFMQPSSGIDWERIDALAERIGVRAVFYQALFLANQIFSAPLPANLSPAIHNDRKALKIAKLVMLRLMDMDRKCAKRSRWCKISRWYQDKYYQLYLRTGWEKFKYVCSHFGPSSHDFEIAFFSDRWYFLYYLMRPFTWLYRRFK